jgi:hypothetical protein
MCGRLRVGKSFLHILQHWSVQPCVRPFDAVHRTAGQAADHDCYESENSNPGAMILLLPIFVVPTTADDLV